MRTTAEHVQMDAEVPRIIQPSVFLSSVQGRVTLPIVRQTFRQQSCSWFFCIAHPAHIQAGTHSYHFFSLSPPSLVDGERPFPLPKYRAHKE